MISCAIVAMDRINRGYAFNRSGHNKLVHVIFITNEIIEYARHFRAPYRDARVYLCGPYLNMRQVGIGRVHPCKGIAVFFRGIDLKISDRSGSRRIFFPPRGRLIRVACSAIRPIFISEIGIQEVSNNDTAVQGVSPFPLSDFHSLLNCRQELLDPGR